MSLLDSSQSIFPVLHAAEKLPQLVWPPWLQSNHSERILSESQQCWFCLVFIPRMLLCYVLCPADLIIFCCVLNLRLAEDVLIVGERLIIRTQWERSMRQKDCQIVPLSTDIWTLHVCAIYIVYCQTISTQRMYIVTWSHCHIISTQHIVGK